MLVRHLWTIGSWRNAGFPLERWAVRNLHWEFFGRGSSGRNAVFWIDKSVVFCRWEFLFPVCQVIVSRFYQSPCSSSSASSSAFLPPPVLRLWALPDLNRETETVLLDQAGPSATVF